MPLSTVLGAQSLVQPAVCTTATRPASPFTGQAIYDTTTATTLVWNGTAWVGIAGGLVCVKAQTTQSGATRVEIDDIFSATYRNYLIIIEQSNGANVLSMQMNASGTPVTTSTYNYQFIQASSTTVSSGRTAAAASGQINGNATTKSYTVLQVFAPFIAQATIYRADTYIDNNDLAQPFIQNRIGNQQGSTSFTGIDILSTTSFDSTITCYGYGITL